MRSPRTHFFLALVIGLAAFAGYWTWYAVVSDESQHVADLEAQIKAANKDVTQIAAARIALTEIADDEATVQSYFVPDTGVVSFINNLEQLGTTQKADVKVLSVSTLGTSTPMLSLSLSVTGTFDSVMRTIGLIEYAPYDLYLSKLSVSELDKNSWQANVSLTVGSSPQAPVASTTRSSS